ncbi:hypothetical protein RCCGE510_11104 [Rhizobium sp. CCGE 510]|nr:hypothetical protein RCCGE510_11104 [Rhizobium sp. CCGE 510]
MCLALEEVTDLDRRSTDIIRLKSIVPEPDEIFVGTDEPACVSVGYDFFIETITPNAAGAEIM